MGAIILECIIALIFGVIAYYVIPFLKRNHLFTAVTIAVQAAEQIFKESGLGKEKFAYVKNWIENTFDIDEDYLTALIESKVYEMNNAKAVK